ncbi:MAG: hypothetical protein HC912_05195 [Saprospiraceae bacterium]|nr:hypothetical protein [Saprospiraceae bacterium]
MGNRDTLIAIANKVGLAEAGAFLQSMEGLREVRHEQQAYQQAGIRSVPAYILNEKYLIQGAQPPALSWRLLKRYLARINIFTSKSRQCLRACLNFQRGAQNS